MSHQFAGCSLSVAVLLAGPVIGSAEVYEMRTYTNPGKLDDLHSRFRDHTVELFKKHGMESVGYWVPTDEPNSTNTLIYVLRHESREAAKASWVAFLSDLHPIPNGERCTRNPKPMVRFSTNVQNL